MVMFIYSFSEYFNIRGAICRTRKRQGVLSGHIISPRMEIREQMASWFLLLLNRSTLLWETCSPGARGKKGDGGQRGRQRKALFCRVRARGAWQAAGEAGRWAGRGGARRHHRHCSPRLNICTFPPKELFFSVTWLR